MLPDNTIVTNSSVVIFAGHFGSGKTENAINYSVHLRAQQYDVKLIDLDIVNPYFRSREAKDYLESQGIQTILPPKELMQVDFPVIVPQVKGALEQPRGKVIVDLGGDPSGALPIGGYAGTVPADDYDMWAVINMYRPQTKGKEEIVEMMEGIQKTTRLNFTGIVNNTHMKWETKWEDILAGLEVCGEVSYHFGIPIVYTALPNHLQIDGKQEKKLGKILKLSIHLKTPWEQ